MTKAKLPTEYDEQVAFVEWLELKGLRFSKVAQDTWTPSWGQKVRNRRSGLRRGVPDLLVVVPGRLLLFVELKRLKRGKVEQEQLDWVDALNSVPNVRARVCLGCDEAIRFVTENL